MKKNTLILRQKLNVKMQDKNLLLESIKVYAKKVVKHAIKITASQLADLKKSASADEFNDKFIKKYKFVNALHLDNQAFKKQECRHVRYRSTSNRVAQLLNEKLVTSYDKKTAKTKTAKTKTAKTKTAKTKTAKTKKS